MRGIVGQVAFLVIYAAFLLTIRWAGSAFERRRQREEEERRQALLREWQVGIPYSPEVERKGRR